MSTYTGTKWGDSGFGVSGGKVTWSFATLGSQLLTFDASIVSASLQSSIRAAFDLWESVADIDFIEVADSLSSGVRLAWDHLDGAGGTLAKATWMYLGSTTTYSEIGFDLGDSWRPSTLWSGGGQDFYAVAVHEIGHVIGLGHVDEPSSIMYEYATGQSALSAQDTAAIQALYGPARLQSFNGTELADLLRGTSRDDSIIGGGGRDTIVGAQGNDVLNGGSGDDLVQGGQGNDTLYGGDDNDIVYGDFGDDVVNGNVGDDEINGNAGNDNLRGGQGNDTVSGGQGNDVLFGDLGNDFLSGDFGDDAMTGGAGADVFQFRAGQGNDVINDFDALAGDRISLFGQTYASAEAGGSTTLFLSGGGTIVLIGVTGDEFGAQFVA